MTHHDWTVVTAVFVVSYVLLRYVLPRPGWFVRMSAHTRGLRQDVTVAYWRAKRKYSARRPGWIVRLSTSMQEREVEKTENWWHHRQLMEQDKK